MSHNNNIYYNEDRYKIEKSNRVDQLENMVENYTKTERHLKLHPNFKSLRRLSEWMVNQSKK